MLFGTAVQWKEACGYNRKHGVVSKSLLMFSMHPVLWEHPPSSPLQGYAIFTFTSKLLLKRDKGPMHLSTKALPALKTLGSQYLGNLNLSYFVNLLPAELGVLCIYSYVFTGNHLCNQAK